MTLTLRRSMPLAPATIVLALAYALPLLWLVPLSLQTPDGAWSGLGNYARALEDPVFIGIMSRTFRVAFLTAAGVVFIAYPVAWQLSRVPRRYFPYLAALIAVPLLTSTIVRSEAWVFLLLPDGPINAVLGLLPGAPKVALLRTEIGVIVAMTQVLLPVGLLPLLAAFYDLDPNLVTAARGLGARPVRVWTAVILPLTAPAAAVSASVTFVLALGFWVTPSIVGGHQSTLIAQLISQQASLLLNIPYASTLAVILIATAIVLGALGLAGSRMIRRARA